VNWQLASFVLLAVVLAAGFAWYERSQPPAKVLSLVAALAALGTVGRIAFAPIPNVKPTTDIALFAGFALGPVPGFAVGATAALASNVFFGQGPWTPWQMLAWGMCGALGGLLRKAVGRDLGRWPLAFACAAAGVMFGLVMDGYQWLQGAEQDAAHYLAVSATSLPYNVAHVVGNIVFCLLLGPTFVRALDRYRRRFEVRWAPAASAAAVVAALAVVLGAGLFAPAPAAASSASRAAAYLTGSQNSDGGFGGGRGQSSTQIHTGWAALGLAATGRNPADVSSGGNSIVDYMRSKVGSVNDIGELERTVLALSASGVDPRSFGGRDLVAELRRKRSSNGSWSSNNGWTAFGALALKATGSPGVRGSARWLVRHQNRDGGFGFRPKAVSDVDDTGAVLQALAAGGLRGSKSMRRAIRYLKRVQNPDGGFAQMRRQASNAQSTSWAVQGLVAAGRNPARFRRSGRNPLGYLKGLQAGDGSIRYSRSSGQTPVWVTAQALDALERKAFPLAAPPRRARSAQRADEGSGSGNGAAGGGGSAGEGKKAKGPKPGAGAPAPDAATPAPTPTDAAPTTPSEDATPATAAASERAADRAAARDDGSGAWRAWVGGALVAGVAALALWRIMRRRWRGPHAAP
jgi:energy-coupling factor transport system substrate-specific component